MLRFFRIHPHYVNELSVLKIFSLTNFTDISIKQMEMAKWKIARESGIRTAEMEKNDIAALWLKWQHQTHSNEYFPILVHKKK